MVRRETKIVKRAVSTNAGLALPGPQRYGAQVAETGLYYHRIHDA